jgi:hypothetical protein
MSRAHVLLPIKTNTYLVQVGSLQPPPMGAMCAAAGAGLARGVPKRVRVCKRGRGADLGLMRGRSADKLSAQVGLGRRS